MGLTIGLIIGAVILLAIVAVVLLSTDVLKGDIGGRHTLERARKLLVVSTDDATKARGADWAAHHAETHADVKIVPLDASQVQGDFNVYLHVQEAINAEQPDAVVWVLHGDEGRHPEEGPYAMAKRELGVPMDAIVVSDSEPAAPSA